MSVAVEFLDIAGLREHLRLANSYNRLPKLLEVAYLCEWSDWVSVLGEQWTVCDNIGLHISDLVGDSPFADIVESPKALRDGLMDQSERAALDALPEVVTIWRGCYANNKWGLSWSLDRAKAARFPNLHRYRQNGQAFLVKATVRRDDIIALKLDRDEAEAIAYRPKHVATIRLSPN